MNTKSTCPAIEYDIRESNIFSLIFPRTFIIRDNSEIRYLSEQNAKHDEEEVIKAQLYLWIVERYKYPSRLVELGNYVKTGSAKNKRYLEADAVIRDRNGNVRIIFEVSTFDEYEKNKERIIRDLFDLAESLRGSKKPKYLIYFSRAFKNGSEKIKIVVINYFKFDTFASWKKSGCPEEKDIPCREA